MTPDIHHRAPTQQVAILISKKRDLKIKVTRDKAGQYIMIEGSIQEEDITTVNIYAPIRQTLTRIKGEVDTPLTPIIKTEN